MRIAKINEFDHINYPGKLAAVVLSSGCNYRCPACHSPDLLKSDSEIRKEDFFKYLDQNKKWIDGVVLCGGEPTMQHSLPYFAEELKKRNLSVKLDTNGSDFRVLGRLLEEKLIDYVAMDVKGPFKLYRDLTGIDSIDRRDDLEKSIAIVANFPDYEYRTTVVPVIRYGKGKDISFMTPEEIGETAKRIYDCTGITDHKYFLQKFVPAKTGLLDKRLESFPETPKGLMDLMLIEARKYLPRTELRY
ncbi:MAG: anaerobic ribonucleoside-triphosphate reductase activating protein [Nanoarchaeota archaeon]|nr:anaerobic ribonucleoside-triphosphate reductase activating protein [Nanoarchaeota archaeon]